MSATAVPGSVGLGRDGQFARFLTSRLALVAGARSSYVLLPVLAFQLTDSSTWTSAVTAAEGFPYLLIGLHAGALADRVDRRRLMIWAQLACIPALLSVPVALASGLLTPYLVLLVAVLAQTTWVLSDAANMGALPSLVTAQQLPAAQSAVYGAATVTELVAIAAAGIGLSFTSPGYLLVGYAGACLASILLLRGIRRPLWNPERARRSRATRTGYRGEIVGGLRFLWRVPLVRWQTLVLVGEMLAVGLWLSQLPPWVAHTFGGRDANWHLGVIWALWGAGAFTATIALPPLVERVGEARLTVLALPVAALGAAGCALSRNLAEAAVATFVFGVAHLLVIVNAITLRQRITPEHLQSRVGVSGRVLSYGVAWPLGSLVGAWASQAGGQQLGLAFVAGIIALTATLAWLSPLRSIPSLSPRHDSGL